MDNRGAHAAAKLAPKAFVLKITLQKKDNGKKRNERSIELITY